MGRPRKNPNQPSGYVPKKVTALEGATDVLTDSDLLWDAVARKILRISKVYGFSRAELPLVEDFRLYEQFYKPVDKGELAHIGSLVQNPSMAIRPSLLPSVLRAYYEHKLYETAPFHKWYFSGFVARYLQEQKKLEQDFEFGFELFGSFSHLAEAHAIAAVWELLKSLGLEEPILEINNIGEENCQKIYEQNLTDFLLGRKMDLCDSCNSHITLRPLNVLRCGRLDCQAIISEAPTVLDFLSEDSNKHFTNILEALDELSVPYQLNPLYAGPSGHVRTNFAIKCKVKDETWVIGEGGYHDGLMQNLSGKNYCAFGFVGSLLKIRQAVEALKIEVSKEQYSEVFLVPLGELAAKKSLRLFKDLTTHKITVYDNFGNMGVKNQLKAAEAQKAPIALIMGQKEAVDEMVILRDVKSGMQEVISYDKIVEEVKKRLGR